MAQAVRETKLVWTV